MDTRLYLDVNALVATTHFAHGVATAFAEWGFLAVLGLVVVAGYWRARTGRTGGGTRQLAGSLWSPLAAAASFGIAQLVAQGVGRLRPYEVLPQAVVLAHRTGSPGMPSAAVALAGAVVAACFLARDGLLGGLSTVVALALAFDEVYVGADYPGDVLAGLGLGTVVVLAGALVLLGPIETAVGLLGRSPLGPLLAPVASRRRNPFLAAEATPADQAASVVGARASAAGPAGRPPALAATGAVRILEDRPLAPRPPGRAESAAAGAAGARGPAAP